MTQLSMNVYQCDGCDATVARKARIDSGWLRGMNRKGEHVDYCPDCESNGNANVLLSSRLQALPSRYAVGRAG